MSAVTIGPRPLGTGRIFSKRSWVTDIGRLLGVPNMLRVRRDALHRPGRVRRHRVAVVRGAGEPVGVAERPGHEHLVQVAVHGEPRAAPGPGVQAKRVDLPHVERTSYGELGGLYRHRERRPATEVV